MGLGRRIGLDMALIDRFALRPLERLPLGAVKVRIVRVHFQERESPGNSLEPPGVLRVSLEPGQLSVGDRRAEKLERRWDRVYPLFARARFANDFRLTSSPRPAWARPPWTILRASGFS
jgi:hypothetical protein